MSSTESNKDNVVQEGLLFVDIGHITKIRGVTYIDFLTLPRIWVDTLLKNQPSSYRLKPSTVSLKSVIKITTTSTSVGAWRPTVVTGVIESTAYDMQSMQIPPSPPLVVALLRYLHRICDSIHIAYKFWITELFAVYR